MSGLAAELSRRWDAKHSVTTSPWVTDRPGERVPPAPAPRTNLDAAPHRVDPSAVERVTLHGVALRPKVDLRGAS